MKVTCLHDKHVALGALISPFGGFDMPIQYKGIVDEHNAVRIKWAYSTFHTWVKWKSQALKQKNS